jgi:hypothetical protein
MINNSISFVGTFGKGKDNQIESPPELKFHYEEIDYLQEIELQDIPEFAKIILTHPYIPNTEKRKFCDLFLKLYLEDINFKKNYDGQYIVFLNMKYYGISKDLGEVMSLEEERNRRYSIKIGKMDRVRNTRF